MELIHFQGLNCFHDCVITLAAAFGLPFAAAFSTLWSEADFRYDPYREAYLSKRIITNLTRMGARVRCFDCFSPEEVQKHLSLFPEDQYATIGMDAYYIPWCQLYGVFHGPHYFIIENTGADSLVCHDPTYGKSHETLSRQDILAHTFDVCRVSRACKGRLPASAKSEALAFLQAHSQIRKALLSRVQGAAAQKGDSVKRLARYIDALICNRYLFRFFLESQPEQKRPPFLSPEHFRKWTAVKNGLYKACITGSSEQAIRDLCDYICLIMEEEGRVAEAIIHNRASPAQ